MGTISGTSCVKQYSISRQVLARISLVTHSAAGTISNVFNPPPPPKKIQSSQNLENEGTREWFPLFLSIDQETPVPKRHEHDGRNEVVYHRTGKLFPQE
jgi:hypothetical protein